MLDCFRQSAHFALFVAHFLLAASHRFLVQASTCTAGDGLVDVEAEAAGAGLVVGGDAGACAMSTT